jgi:hypothetical protein
MASTGASTGNLLKPQLKPSPEDFGVTTSHKINGLAKAQVTACAGFNSFHPYGVERVEAVGRSAVFTAPS